MEAFEDLGITKLATRVSEMRRSGENIIGVTETKHNRFGEKVHYKRYRIGEKE